MKFIYSTLIFFLFFSIQSFSQDMQEGFTYLETGKYKEAEVFFKDILKEYPTNKTARLCYGRAIGLNGKATAAVTLFTNLLKDYPTDFEVKLNYAESLLWSKNYPDAKIYYQTLLKENDKSFAALLGYANTLSNLKEFEDALINVDKALEVLPGNPNALVSKKYMRLGLASKKVSDQKYKEAETILKENFTSFKDDKETLLNLANLYLISKQIEKAKNTYEIIGKKPEDKLISLNGIALAHHLDGDDKTALTVSKTALKSIDKNTSETLKNQTIERYIQALIWNKKYTSAKTEIDKLLDDNKTPENWMLSLRATLNIYKSDFKKSINDYNLILKKDSASFDGNLGKANALKASGYYNNAYKSAENTLVFYEKQKDASNFIKELDLSFTPYVETKYSYSYDNGNNEANAYDLKAEVPFSTKFKILANYNFRTTLNNQIDSLKATTNNLLLGVSYQLLNNLTLKGSFGVTSSDSESKKYNQLLTDISLNIKPFKLQSLELGYKRDVQNFNAALLNDEIVQNNLILNYSLNTNFNLGWFTQYYYTWQSDDNARNLLFTSLYYNIFAKPSIKAGFNYQNISFKESRDNYFSPSKFNAVEIFVNLIKDEAAAKNKEWFYGLTAATGLQYIEDDDALSTYRVQAKLGYKFSERALLNIYGLQSNIASAVATAGSVGFTYTEFGVRFKWIFLRKPLYKK
ncbi:lipopolysaccharide assembly protein LapB [Polaribacter sp. AHE13PA]|uniref:tetratricopeptide repeat protein n=1 Tax=Polaribacter sp. AHE13PA TaxID=2745562 RepID=UPI001C4E8C4D|nr:tetratricopeptide repeat protein [Polaribacter sp. AHE13PA]QXP67593.1 tetratricopeptide repeat protein [Polaribacter sp. AHE13PA]